MIVAQHFGSISGGKDSQAVLCLMVERIERKGLAAFGNRAPRFLAADNGHENPITLDHIGYLDDWLRQRTGLRIEIVSASRVCPPHRTGSSPSSTSPPTGAPSRPTV